MDAATASVLVAATSTIATIAVAFLQMRTRNAVLDSASEAKGRDEVTAQKAEEVKATLEVHTAVTDARLSELKSVAHETHTLVNSNMGVQLKLNAAVTRRLAGLTGHADDLAAADLAEQMYQEHLKKQAQVDAAKPADE